MNFFLKYFSLVSAIALSLLCPIPCGAEKVQISPPIFIAHAGGGINQLTYTNSLEALDSNYNKGFRCFEIDFSWTLDQELVAIHDWEKSLLKDYQVVGKEIPRLAEFLLLKTKTGLTQLSLEEILRWAADKEDAFIVTDVKSENLKALGKISRDFEKYMGIIVPQVYSYDEYDEVMRLGYDNIILTIYRMETNLDELKKFSDNRQPFAITMPWGVAKSGIAKYLSNKRTKVYAHTINNIDLLVLLRKHNVWGIYTDFIHPP